MLLVGARSVVRPHTVVSLRTASAFIRAQCPSKMSEPYYCRSTLRAQHPSSQTSCLVAHRRC